jgi:hypothetical protein
LCHSTCQVLESAQSLITHLTIQTEDMASLITAYLKLRVIEGDLLTWLAEVQTENSVRYDVRCESERKGVQKKSHIVPLFRERLRSNVSREHMGCIACIGR